MRTRLPMKKWDRNARFFDITLFKQLPFSVYCLGSFLILWGLFAPWDYLPSMVLSHDISKDIAVYTIVVLKRVPLFPFISFRLLLTPHQRRFSLRTHPPTLPSRQVRTLQHPLSSLQYNRHLAPRLLASRRT
jgi:hypothetical protein